MGSSQLIPPQPPDSPCSSLFSYDTLPGQNVWIGIIKVNVPHNRLPLELFVHLQIQAALPTVSLLHRIIKYILIHTYAHTNM